MKNESQRIGSGLSRRQTVFDIRDAAYFDLLYYLIGITIILKERLRVAVIEPNVLEAMTRTAVPVLAKRSRAKAI